MITPDFLRAATGCTPTAAEAYATPLAKACIAFGITSRERVAAFLAQISHESASLSSVIESFNYTPERLIELFSPTKRITEQEAQAYGRTNEHVADEERLANILYGGYWGAKNLGNTQDGDGWRYRGRGLLQETGRSNYRALTTQLRSFGAPDFEDNPDKLATPEWAAWAAAAGWTRRGLNELADAGAFDDIGSVINTGRRGRVPHGADSRRTRWERAKAALAALSTPAAAPTPPPTPEKPAAAPVPPVGRPSAPTGKGLTWPFQQPAPNHTPQENPMTPLLSALAGVVIDMFSTKVQKEIGRHTDPAAAEQLTKTVVDAAKTATGIEDPKAALAEVVAKGPDSPVLQQVQASTLETLEQLAPLLDKLAQWEAEAAARDAADREAASARNQREVAGGSYDMTKPLLGGAFVGVGIVMLTVGGIAVAQAIKTGTVDKEILITLSGLIGWVTAKAGTIYDYRFGGVSRTSAAQIVSDEIVARRK